MKTKSPKNVGAYSKAYGKKRAKKGFQTANVDLTVTGDLMDRGLTFAVVNPNEVVVGFTEKQSDKADWMEDYYGTIFQLSEEEINIATDI